MYEQQIANEASQLAEAIEQNPNNMNVAAQMLFADTQGMRPGEAHALIDQTNQITQSDSQRDGYQYGQIVNPHERNQYGLPIVELVDGNNQIGASVALQINEQPAPPAYGYQGPPPAYGGYEPPPPAPYYERPQAYCPPGEYGCGPERGPVYLAPPAESLPALGVGIVIGLLAGGLHNRR